MGAQQQLLQQDLAVRQEVLDPERSFIVQAPAGSGKTELLTQRILKLLTRVSEPENILAITFTRKAAGEMRARLLESLRKAATEPCPQAPHLAQNWELAQAVLMQDRALGWNLLSHPNRLAVRTMDGFNARLVRQMPLLATFGSVPGVSDDAEELYRAAARATLQMVEDADLGESVATLLRWLDNDAARVERMVTDMLGHRDQWLPYIVGGQMDRSSLEQTLQSSVESTLQQCLQGLQQQLGPSGGDALVAIASSAAVAAQEGNKQPAVIACEGLQQLPDGEAESLPLWKGIAGLFLKSDGGFRLTSKSWNKNDGFPASAAGKLQKEQMLAFSQQISESAVAAVIQKIPLLPPVTYQDEQWRVIDALFQVLLLAQANLMMEFEAQGVVDHTEIAQRARHALGDEASPTALALRLDHQIQHILVDEFQDTSHGQFDLLSQLTAEWSHEEARTLFLVGDPMQSIYRFRHAEVGLFIKAIDEGVGGVPLHYRQLSANFRSESGVVEWVNRCFVDLFPKQSDRFSGAISYAASISTRDATTSDAVLLHPQPVEDREAEAERVVQLVQQTLSETATENKVAILVRSRSHLIQITQQLYRAGVLYRAVEIESLGDRPLIRDLLSLTRALLHLADREAWLALLRGPWCGVPLQELLLLIEGEPQRTLYALMREPERIERLSELSQQRLNGLNEVVAVLMQQRGEQPLVRWIQQGWRRLGGAAIYQQLSEPGQAEREADAFFDLLAEMEQGGEVIDLQRLHQRLLRQNLRSEVNPEEAPRVEVMTIHKSKGLQFDTVILPGLGRMPRSSDRKLLHWLEVPQQELEGEATMQLLLSPVRAAEQSVKEDALGQYVQKIEQQREKNELSRLLYVAITRAERKVHLLGAAKIDSKGALGRPAARSLLEQLWPQLEEQYQQQFEQTDLDMLQQQQEGEAWVQPQPQRLSAVWQLPSAPQPIQPLSPLPEQQSVYQWGSSRAIHIGTVVHALLQWIAESGVEQWVGQSLQPLAMRVDQQLRQLGVVREERPGAVLRVVEALQKVVDDPQGCYFLTQHEEARSEWSLTAQLDGVLTHITIDRSFIDAQGVRWIIDWKSSSHSGGGLEQFLDEEEVRYGPQLRKYAAVLKKLEQRPQKLVLYFPMHQQVREVSVL